MWPPTARNWYPPPHNWSCEMRTGRVRHDTSQRRGAAERLQHGPMGRNADSFRPLLP